MPILHVVSDVGEIRAIHDRGARRSVNTFGCSESVQHGSNVGELVAVGIVHLHEAYVSACHLELLQLLADLLDHSLVRWVEAVSGFAGGRDLPTVSRNHPNFRSTAAAVVVLRG